MELTSLGYRTDLALLELGGSVVEDRGDHLVVCTPHNPGYWWGNFLLMADVPAPDDTDMWLRRFAETFPSAQHLAFGVDGTSGSVAELRGFAAAGLHVEIASVMTAQAVHAPRVPNDAATYREVTSDADWQQSIELRVACDDRGLDPTAFREFATGRAGTLRQLAEGGHGAWFGAFVKGRLVSQMGLYAASRGLARFQSVETHPDFRRQGLAGTLVRHVSQYGFEELGASTLVMVADPEDVAIRLYRSVGFTDSETQLQAERPPD